MVVVEVVFGDSLVSCAVRVSLPLLFLTKRVFSSTRIFSGSVEMFRRFSTVYNRVFRGVGVGNRHSKRFFGLDIIYLESAP